MKSVLGISIPDAWATVPLKHATSLVNRGSAPEYVDCGPVRAVGQASNQHGGIVWEKTRFHDFTGDPETLKGFLREGDILVNSTGTGTLGRVGYFEGAPDDLPCMADSHITVVRTRAEELHPKFAFYWLGSRPFQEYVYASMVVGATNQIELNRDRLRDAPVPLPAIEEQRRIADFLDAETARIDTIVRLRTLQRNLALARMDTRWSQCIAEDGEKFSWVPLRRFIASIVDGPFGSALTSNHYSDSGARVIRLGNIGRAMFRDGDVAYISNDYFRQLRRYQASPGDLIVAGLGDQGNPLGRACVVPDGIGNAIVKADCFRLRLDSSKMTHDYAAWALSSTVVGENIGLISRGSTRSRINLDVVRDIRIPSPPIEMQADRVSLLGEAFEITKRYVGLCDEQKDLLAERRQALITAAVTGQFDVTTASGRNLTQGV